jgi:Zn-dependent protease with chaperone function
MSSEPTRADLHHKIETALPITRAQAPALWRLVDEVAEQLGTAGPDNLLIVLDSISFATELPLRISDATFTGRTLGLSLTLLYLLSEQELRALIAHELDHFRRHHTRPQRLASLLTEFIAITLAIVAIGVARLPDPLSALLRPPVQSGFTRFARWQQARMLDREFRADRAAAEIAGAAACASLLIKSTLVARIWSIIVDEHLQNVAAGAPRIGAVVAMTARTLFTDSDVRPWLGKPEQSVARRTHPHYVERLAALGDDLPTAWALAQSTKTSVA